MSRRVKIRFKNEMVDAEEVDFETINESWNEYACVDGSRVRLKVVASKIVRVIDKYTPAGEPLYIVASSNILAVTPAPGMTGPATLS